MSNIKRVVDVYDALKIAIDSAQSGDFWHECELWLGYRADLVPTSTQQARRVSVIRSNGTLEQSGVACELLISKGSIVIECQVAELQASGSAGMGTIESRKAAYLALDQLINNCMLIVMESSAYASISFPTASVEHDTDLTAPIYKAWLVISEQSYQSQ